MKVLIKHAFLNDYKLIIMVSHKGVGTATEGMAATVPLFGEY